MRGKTMAAGGNGSPAAPWNNLNALVGAQPGYSYPLLTSAPYRQVPVPGRPAVVKPGPKGGPIAPGDKILLMGGNYGDVWLNIWNAEVANSDFVTIAAAPGQTPILTSLLVSSTNKWVFDGLKVQSLQSAARSGNALVTIKDGGAAFPTSDIVLQNMTISSQDNVRAWNQLQWRASARNGFRAESSAGGSHTKCVSLTGSHISNVRIGAQLFAGQLLFSNNQIDHFGDDGLDYAASNLAITKNNIHDNLDVGDGNHPDAMQGQIGIRAPGVAFNRFQNILIDANRIVRQTDPGLPFRGILQGITAFNSDWTNVTVSNNVVVTSACWGIDFASIHNSRIVNNTVVDDRGMVTPGCVTAIGVGDKAQGAPSSSNTAVRNNLASRITIDNRNSGVSADHNVLLNDGLKPMLIWYSGGAIQYLSNPGTYANANVIDSGGSPSEFVNFSPARLTYNLMLKPVARAIGAGTASGAPAQDILGVARTAPTTAGAYGFPN